MRTLAFGALLAAGLVMPACREQNVTIAGRGPSLETAADAGGGGGASAPAENASPPAVDSGADLGLPEVGLADGLVGWWRFDDVGGERMADSSGRGNDGMGVEVTAGAAVTGRQGQGIDLRAAGAHLRVPSSVSINGVYRGFTIAAFIRLEAARPERATILSRQSAYVLGLTAGRPFLSLLVEGKQLPVELSAAVAVTSQRWVHVAASFDGAVARLYLDGKELGTLAVVGTIGSSNVPVTIGARLQGTAVVDGLGAGLDEARLYARPLTGSEIGALANPD